MQRTTKLSDTIERCAEIHGFKDLLPSMAACFMLHLPGPRAPCPSDMMEIVSFGLTYLHDQLRGPLPIDEFIDEIEQRESGFHQMLVKEPLVAAEIMEYRASLLQQHDQANSVLMKQRREFYKTTIKSIRDARSAPASSAALDDQVCDFSYQHTWFTVENALIELLVGTPSPGNGIVFESCIAAALPAYFGENETFKGACALNPVFAGLRLREPLSAWPVVREDQYPDYDIGAFIKSPRATFFRPSTLAGPDLVCVLTNNAGQKVLCLIQAKFVKSEEDDWQQAWKTTEPEHLYTTKARGSHDAASAQVSRVNTQEVIKEHVVGVIRGVISFSKNVCTIPPTKQRGSGDWEPYVIPSGQLVEFAAGAKQSEFQYNTALPQLILNMSGSRNCREIFTDQECDKLDAAQISQGIFGQSSDDLSE